MIKDTNTLDRRLSIAPMMAWTDRHCRFFHRLLSPHALVYTEMVTTGALLNNDDIERFLAFSDQEHPVALQLGGSVPTDLAQCAKIGEDWGYDEINLNCGCPSERVQNNNFGACLMTEPQLVADCIEAMTEAVNIPVTVKTRIGVDEQDDYDFVHRFVETIHKQSGCTVFIMHARKAWLKGLSPKENRTIPEIKYDVVYQLKKDFPQCEILVNGEIKTPQDMEEHLKHCDGVMLGRIAYQEPYALAEFEQALYGTPLPSRSAIVEGMYDYIDQHVENGGNIHHIVKHMLGLFKHQKKGRLWRQILSDMHNGGMNSKLLKTALNTVMR